MLQKDNQGQFLIVRNVSFARYFSPFNRPLTLISVFNISSFVQNIVGLTPSQIQDTL